MEPVEKGYMRLRAQTCENQRFRDAVATVDIRERFMMAGGKRH